MNKIALWIVSVEKVGHPNERSLLVMLSDTVLLLISSSG